MSFSTPPQVLDFSNLSHEALRLLLKKHQLKLTPNEALTIQNEFLKRPPTYAECVLWSIQGSEHCSYKSTRKHLKQFNTEGPEVILGPKEDAGIVEIATDASGRRYGLVVSHESHNHPSQIVPYEGAATGVGGNIRDVCCMGAEVIAIGDSLRFGDLAENKTQWIAEGVVKGIGGYGNPIGIATLAGDLYFDPGYNDNCLVTVVTLGIVREDHIIHSYAPLNAENHVFVLVGKPTDNSGFGGASFASDTLSQEDETANKGAVQEPNAFLERHLLKANYALFHYLQEKNLLNRVGFKDLGAGGIACASVELAHSGGYGAEIYLQQVPVSMDQLDPAIILCSETQERFMWVLPEELVETVLDHYNQKFALATVADGARAAVIGRVRNDDLYVVHHHEHKVVEAKASDITQGILYDRPTKNVSRVLAEPILTAKSTCQEIFLQLLAHENIASRAPLFETYDKQVQGRTHFEAGSTDAGVMQPFNEDKYPPEIQSVGVALSMDHNPRFCQIDAYWGAVNAVCEAVRNVAAVGAKPLAITDCLCFGNPEVPEEMQRFVDAVKGIKDACQALKLIDHPDHSLPVISGNVSLYNESQNGTIPPSPIISCVGKLDNVMHAVTLDLKQPDSFLLLIGARKDECGGSVYYALHHELGAQLPKPDLAKFSAEIHALHSCIQEGLILAAHDISEGGIAIALAEMCFKHAIGFNVTIPGDLPLAKKYFSETGGFILEVSRHQLKKVESIFRAAEIETFLLGTTTKDAQINIEAEITIAIHEAKQIWSQGLRERLM